MYVHPHHVSAPHMSKGCEFEVFKGGIDTLPAYLADKGAYNDESVQIDSPKGVNE